MWLPDHCCAARERPPHPTSCKWRTNHRATPRTTHHDCVHCPAKRQRCDPSRVLTPRVVVDKQTLSNLESVQPHRSSPLWKQPHFSLAELATSKSHSMGWFKTLPNELLYIIFELLEFRSLSLISMTSKNMSTAALTYLQSAKGLKHVMPIVSAGHRTSIDPMEFRGVGKQHNNYVTCISYILEFFQLN